MEKSKKEFKWWLLILCSLLLAIIVFLAICIVPYLVHRGQLDPNVYYAFNHRTGTAVIYGKGSTYVYSTNTSYSPSSATRLPEGTPAARPDPEQGVLRYYPDQGCPGWSPLAREAETTPLRKVIVLPGVLSLDTGLLQDCVDLREVYLPDTIVNFATDAINADGDHDRTPLTIYFDGDGPRINYGYTRLPPNFGLYDVTIVHRPDAAGWVHGYTWWDPPEMYEEFPSYKALESRNFHINWLPLF